MVPLFRTRQCAATKVVVSSKCVEGDGGQSLFDTMCWLSVVFHPIYPAHILSCTYDSSYEAWLHLDQGIFRGGLAVLPKADNPTLTLTATPWGDQCLDAVACESLRSIRPARVLCLQGL